MSQGRRERTANPELPAAEPRSPAIDARGVDRGHVADEGGETAAEAVGFFYHGRLTQRSVAARGG